MRKILKIETVADGLRFSLVKNGALKGIEVESHLATFGRGNLQFGMMMSCLASVDYIIADEIEIDVAREDAEMIVKNAALLLSKTTDLQESIIRALRRSLTEGAISEPL